MKVISAIVVVFCVHVANTSWADELSNIDDAFSFIERSSDKATLLRLAQLKTYQLTPTCNCLIWL